MAKKKLPTIEDAIKSLKDVASRATLSNYYYVNNVLLSKTESPTEDPDDASLVVLNVELSLWKEIVDDSDLVKVEIDDPSIRAVSGGYKPYFKFGSNDTIASDLWLPIDVTEELFKGKVFKIKIKDFEYEIPINRDLMPLKLKKAEYDGVSYRIFQERKSVILAIKKYFPPVKDVEASGFHIIKLYRVI